MRKLLLLMSFTVIPFLVISTNVKAQVLGTLDAEGGPTLTFSASTLLADWNDFLNGQSIEANLTSVTIVTVTANEEYVLVATGAEYKSSVQLQIDNGNELSLLTSEGIITICTTFDCRNDSGCTAKIGFCAPCSGDCTKSTSLSPYLF